MINKTFDLSKIRLKFQPRPVGKNNADDRESHNNRHPAVSCFEEFVLQGVEESEVKRCRNSPRRRIIAVLNYITLDSGCQRAEFAHNFVDNVNADHSKIVGYKEHEEGIPNKGLFHQITS